MHDTSDNFSSLLADSATRLLSERYAFAHRRHALATGRLDRAMWTRFADMGWLALLLPEADGGLGHRLRDAAPLLQALGRHLVLEPYTELAVSAARLLCATQFAQRETWLQGLAAGTRVVALAHFERGMPNEAALPRARCEASATGGRLHGRKHGVVAGPCAHAWIVTACDAREPQRLRAWLVPSGAAGVQVREHARIDGTPLADLDLDGVEVAAALELQADDLDAVFARVQAETLAAVCQQAVGAMEGMHAATLAYAQLRQQFGTAIARLQAVQHRLVDMYARTEAARAVSGRALDIASGGAPDAAALRELSACKAAVAASCRFVAEQGVQLHGGIGMTDECVASHYFKRLLVLEKQQGGADWHLARLAATLDAQAPRGAAATPA